jgi:hypothetical protein
MPDLNNKDPYIKYKINGEEKIFVFDTQISKSGFENPIAVCENFCRLFGVPEVTLYIPGKEPIEYKKK